MTNGGHKISSDHVRVSSVPPTQMFLGAGPTGHLFFFYRRQGSSPRARTLLKPSRTDVTEDVVGSIIASQVTSS